MHIRKMLRKPRAYWYKKPRIEDWWLKMIDIETSASSCKKTFRMTEYSFIKLLAKVSKKFSSDSA